MRARLEISVAALACLLTLGWQAATALGADRVYWANEGNDAHPISFTALDGSGGGDLATSGAATSGAVGVAIDPTAGRVYWGNGGGTSSWISYANLDGSGGGVLNTAGATVATPEGLAIDEATGRIYWGNLDSNSHPIGYANLDGTGGGNLNTTGATANEAQGVAIDAGSRRIYWANFHSNTIPISYASLDGSGGGDLNSTGATADFPSGVAIDDAAGKIYWANQAGNSISYARLDNTGGGGQLNLNGATPNDPRGVAIDPNAGKLYWVNAHSNGTTGPAVSYARLDGSGGGDLSSAGATTATPTFPVLLEAPEGTAPPTISGGAAAGSKLSCSKGTWAADLTGAFLFRAPHSYAYQWTLNGADIAGATSSSYTPAGPGSYACQVTASNQAGSTSRASASITIAAGMPPPLSLSKVGQSHRRWREGGALPHIARARKAPVGTTFSFTLSEAARVRFAFMQRHARRWVLRGSLSRTVSAGAHSLRFQGRISKHKRLRPGSYTLLMTATNSLGQRSTARLHFTIVKG